ncbi:MAG: hypothetical protein AVDCRST_MAG08-2897, partial [uncultured Acetobacteraceae bacterium]
AEAPHLPGPRRGLPRGAAERRRRAARDPGLAQPAAPRAGRPPLHRRRGQGGLPGRHPHLARLAGPRPGLRLARLPGAPGADRRQPHPPVGDRRRGRPQRARSDQPSPLRQDRRRPVRPDEARPGLLRPHPRARDRGRRAGHVRQPDAVQRLGPAVRGAAEPLRRLALEGRQQRQRDRRRPARDRQGHGRPDAQRPGHHGASRSVRPRGGGRAGRPAQRALRGQQRNGEHGRRLGLAEPHARRGEAARRPAGLAPSGGPDVLGLDGRPRRDRREARPQRRRLDQPRRPKPRGRPAGRHRRQGQHPRHRPHLGHRRPERRLGVEGLHPRPQHPVHGLAPDAGPRRALRALRRGHHARADRGGRRGAGGHPADPRGGRDARPPRGEEPRRPVLHGLRAGEPAGRRFRGLRAGGRRRHARPVGGRRRGAGVQLGGRAGRHGGRRRLGAGRGRRAALHGARRQAGGVGAAARGAGAPL